MIKRPVLDKDLDSKIFRDFYYLKQELVEFCRNNALPTSGGKIEITDRIAYFLDTGKIKATSSLTKKHTKSTTPIRVDTKIEANFVCTEKHRTFFKEHIGNSFSFNVTFQKWLKNNGGKTYQEAITAYYQLLKIKKKGKTKIDKQFEYNTYIRDFFSDNQGKSLEEAIICWKYKRAISGHNKPESITVHYGACKHNHDAELLRTCNL